MNSYRQAVHAPLLLMPFLVVAVLLLGPRGAGAATTYLAHYAAALSCHVDLVNSESGITMEDVNMTYEFANADTLDDMAVTCGLMSGGAIHQVAGSTISYVRLYVDDEHTTRYVSATLWGDDLVADGGWSSCGTETTTSAGTGPVLLEWDATEVDACMMTGNSIWAIDILLPDVGTSQSGIHAIQVKASVP